MSTLFGTTLSKILRYPHQTWTRHYSKVAKEKQEKYPYIIVQASRGDYKRMVRMFWDSYAKHEPTCKGLGVGKDCEIVLKNYFELEMEEGYPLMALNRNTGDMAGCTINTVSTRDTAYKILGIAKCMECPILRRFFELNAYIMALPNIFKRFNAEKIFEIAFVVVDPEHRGKNLGHRLIAESLKLGHLKGHKVVRVDATNVITAKVCESLGMKKICEMPYDLYVNPETRKPFMEIEYPNVSCQIYVHTCKN